MSLVKEIKKYKEIFKKKKLNEITIDGITIKGKVKPHYKKEKIKASIEINGKIDDVELYAKVGGKVFRVKEEGLSVQEDNIFSAKFGATKPF